MTTIAGLWVAGALLMANSSTIPTYWFVLPLVVAMSCVYSASRYESWSRIAVHSVRLTGMILGVLFLAMALLLVVNSYQG